MKFGTSGIRGVFNADISLRMIYKLCFALSRTFEGNFCLSYDTRQTSKILGDCISAGLCYYGRNVVVLGILPTPALAFLTREKEVDAGLMLTASHNPPEYVGIKIFNQDGIEIDSDYEEKIEELLSKYQERSISTKFGTMIYDYRGKWNYLCKLVSSLKESNRKLKIILDYGNGSASSYTDSVLRDLGHQVITINSHSCSYSTARTLEPNVGSLKETAKLIEGLQADLGIAHDGDGDRVVLIDELGRVIEDQKFSILALLTISTKGTIVLSVNTSGSVEEAAKRLGFKVVRERLGKTFLKMKNEGGVFACEPSKVTDSSWGIWEDGVYIASKTVQYISSLKQDLSELINSIQGNAYYQQNLIISRDCAVNLEKIVFDNYGKNMVHKLDGWKITFNDDSYLLFRISGTEKKIRIYTDSHNEERARYLLKEGISLIMNS